MTAVVPRAPGRPLRRRIPGMTGAARARVAVRAPFTALTAAAGCALYGREISPDALVLATADGHPRAVSVTSWVPARSVAAIRAHAFYGCLVNTEWGKPCDPAQVRSARQDARRMRVGWAIVWKRTSFVYAYLRQVGFRYDYGSTGSASTG